MRYPVDYNGTMLLLAPELAGTMYHLRSRGNVPQRVPAGHVEALRKRGVTLAAINGRGVVLVEGEAASAAVARVEPGLRVFGRRVDVDGSSHVVSPAQASLLRSAMAGEPVELTPSNQAQAYRLRKLGVPIRFSVDCGGYYIGDKT